MCLIKMFQFHFLLDENEMSGGEQKGEKKRENEKLYEGQRQRGVMSDKQCNRLNYDSI